METIYNPRNYFSTGKCWNSLITGDIYLRILCLALNTLRMDKHATWLISSTDIWRPSKWSQFTAVLVTSHSKPQAMQQNEQVKANGNGVTKLMQTFHVENLPKPVQWTVIQFYPCKGFISITPIKWPDVKNFGHWFY
jgi:hypothetical protein